MEWMDVAEILTFFLIERHSSTKNE